MTLDFSLEMSAEKINDRRSRDYFNEVRGCYNAGYYRSCVVMLWSVVICDLLYKLDFLKNALGDEVAKSILEEIKQDRIRNPLSSKWEEKLLNLVNDRMEFFDTATHVTLCTLQKHRHVSAHPVLTDSNKLFEPTKEVARAHLRNALEGLLIRPAMLSRKVFNSFIEDLETNQGVLYDDESVSIYVSAKYGPFLTATIEDELFRSLWKFVFRLTDEQCEKNRAVNWRALVCLLERRPAETKSSIGDDPDYFSDCHFADTPIEALSGFLSRHADIYGLLNEAARVAVKNFVKLDADRHATAWYLSESVSLHASTVLGSWPNGNEIGRGVFQSIITRLRNVDELGPAKKFAIEQYSSSPNYAAADIRFELVRPLISDFNGEELIGLVERCEQNPQTYRRSMDDDHAIIGKRIAEVCYGDFDEAKFPRMLHSLQIVQP